MTETDMVALAKRALTDAAAAERVVEIVLPSVRHGVRILVGAFPEAEDLVQSSMLEILASLRGYRGDASLVTWARGVAFRVVMRHMKRHRRREDYVRLSVVEPEPEETKDSASELRDAIVGHLHALSFEQRVTLTLRVVAGHSVDEVATITGVGVNTARGRIRSALKALRHRLSHDPRILDALSGDLGLEAGR